MRLLDFGNDPSRIARRQALRTAVDDQVKILQDDGTDECGVAIRLDHGVENAVAAKVRQVHTVHPITLRHSAVRVTHVDVPGHGKPKLLYD